MFVEMADMSIMFSRAHSNEAAACLLTRSYFPVAEFKKEKHFLELTGNLRLSKIYIHGNNEEAKGQSGQWNWETKFLMTVLNSLGTASGGAQLQNTSFWLRRVLRQQLLYSYH